MNDRWIGHEVGDFRILELLGRGSISRVYKALQVSLHREVALKVFQEEILTPGEFAERFRREAQYLASFEHPNILPVYASGQEGKVHYMALRLVQGGTLVEWLAEPRPARRIFAVLCDAASGLACLHARGGIHRDLKPTNVLVEDGRGILADFGLARLAEESTITQSGALLGTPLYMAPEQLRRERATPRSDVFSFGLLLHEAFSGRHPYYGNAAPSTEERGSDSRQEHLRRVLAGQAAPIGRKDLPPAIEEIVRRCLSIDPEERYADAREVSLDLEAVTWPDDTKRAVVAEAPEPPPPPSARSRLPLVVATILAFVAGFLVGWSLRR